LVSAIKSAFSASLEPARLPPRQRIVVAIGFGVLASLLAYHQLTGRDWLASDFEFALRAARRLLDGLDPYNDPNVGYGRPYPFDAQFPYPIFAALFAVPFTALSSHIAGALFVGLISGAMAYAVTRRSWWGLVIFCSPSYFVAASVANWSPLLVASACLPWLYALSIVKPTLAAPIMLNYPSRLGYVLATGVVACSLILVPLWPVGWLQSVAGQQPDKYALPILIAPVAVVLLAVVWWRHRTARLLVFFACIPQHAFFYDQLVLWLLPQTWRQSVALSLFGWIAYVSWSFNDATFNPWLAQTEHGPGLSWTAPMFYLPAFALVLWQRFLDYRRSRQATSLHEPLGSR
jgi:hypothetical protein